MRPNEFQEFCREGERADRLAAEGKHREAEGVYLSILSRFESRGEVDSYLAAKAALGLLSSYCKSGERARAFRAWHANIEDSLVGVGVYALENAQAEIDDVVRYDMLCAYLHSIAAERPARAAGAINQYLSRVAEYAVDVADRALLAMTVSNWKTHLREVFGAAIPHAHAEALIAYERQLTEPAVPRAIDFPPATPWTTPEPAFGAVDLEAGAPARQVRDRLRKA